MWWIVSDSLFSLLGLVGIIVLLLHHYGTNTYNYWTKLGTPFLKPKFPFLGTFYEVVFSFKCAHEKQLEIYNAFKGERFVGVFSFKKPLLMIKDPSLIESILIKDFTSFYNRSGQGGDLKKDPLSAHLLNLEDMEWKSLRQKLTPTFSSGKLKGMHLQLVQCSDELVKHISSYADKCEPLEIREVMAKFTTDVIGSCVFGVNTNALTDSESAFRKMGKNLLKPTFKARLRIAVRNQYPQLVRFLRWRGNAAKIQDFFTSMLQNTISFREKNNIVRNDFVQLLMELKKQEIEKPKNGLEEAEHLIIDDHVITSNAFVFFVAGFETTASTLSYCVYELAIHQDIQNKLYEHIVEVLNNHKGEVSYEAVKQMTFLQQVFSETLRLHPPAPEVRRAVTKDYLIPETKIVIPKGSVSVAIPTYSLHHDPEYFPDPEKFKPERFSNPENIRKGTYLPFGDGPRICIGKRFAEMEMQIAMVKVLLKYKFTLNGKTNSPLIYNPSAFLLVPIDGIWVDVHDRV